MLTTSSRTTNAPAETRRRDARAGALPGAWRGGRARWPWRQAAEWAVVMGIIAFNVWWYWRETRAVPRLATVARWMAGQRYAEAEPALREHLRRSPDDGQARTMLARLMAARGDLRGCAAELRRVPLWWPSKAESRYREGQTYLRLDRARDAEAAWRAVVEQGPPHAPAAEIFQDACLALLRLYAVEDRWEDAVPLVWRAHDRAAPADRADWLIVRLRSELERVAPVEAVVPLRRYAAADPDDGEALPALARAEHALGRAAEAIEHFQLCLERHPGDARAWRDYLAMLRSRGDRSAFLAALARAPAAAESEPKLWIDRGLGREWQGDLEGAADQYRQAVARDPFDLESQYRLALVEQRLGRVEAAAAHRESARRLREARGRLRGEFVRYLEAREHHDGADPIAQANELEALAATCAALGWTRAAAACTEERARVEASGSGGTREASHP